VREVVVVVFVAAGGVCVCVCVCVYVCGVSSCTWRFVAHVRGRTARHQCCRCCCFRRSKALCGVMSRVTAALTEGMGRGLAPVLAGGVSTGGAYLMRDVSGTAVAVMKPQDEEAYAPNNPRNRAGPKMGAPGIKHGAWGLCVRWCRADCRVEPCPDGVAGCRRAGGRGCHS
jgi:hypothetical protein